jgi:hypothetical protein
MRQYAFDLRLVPLPQLNNGSGCEGGEHGEIVPALVRSAPDSGGHTHRTRRYTEVQLCVVCPSAHVAELSELSTFACK